MVGAISAAGEWPGSRAARARGIAVALIAHALVLVVWLIEPSSRRPSLEPRPIGVRLVDEARALPDAPALPEPEVRTPPLPHVPIPEVQVARAQPAPAIVAQPVVPQAIVAVDAGPVVAPQAAAPAAPASAPVVASAPPRTVSVTQVRYLRAPEPAYPLASRRAHEEGRVEVRLLVDVAGVPQQLAVQRSSGYERLDEAALAAVRAARFVPYAEDGICRAFWVVVPLIFELDA